MLLGDWLVLSHGKAGISAGNGIDLSNFNHISLPAVVQPHCIEACLSLV